MGHGLDPELRAWTERLLEGDSASPDTLLEAALELSGARCAALWRALHDGRSTRRWHAIATRGDATCGVDDTLVRGALETRLGRVGPDGVLLRSLFAPDVALLIAGLDPVRGEHGEDAAEALLGVFAASLTGRREPLLEGLGSALPRSPRPLRERAPDSGGSTPERDR